MVFHIDMYPNRLHNLIIHNHLIAQDLLMYFTNTLDIQKYYDVLLEIKLSIPLLEVFHNLNQMVELPKNFIVFFVKNCMEQCNAMTDIPQQKKRMIRIVLVFLSNILKQKVLPDQIDLIMSIKQFCLEHNTVREAQEMLKKVIAEQSFSKDSGSSK